MPSPTCRRHFERDAEKRMMNLTFRVGRDSARLCRADQHPGQHGHPRQGHPPRVPPERGRCLQRLQGEAQPGPHPEPRLFPGKSGDQAGPGLVERPGRAERRRRGKIDRRAAAVGRLFEPRAVHHFGLDRPAQFHGQGPAAPGRRQLFALFEVDFSWASPSPICSTRTSCWAAKFSGATTTASISIGDDERNQTYGQTSTGGGVRLGLPGHRICHLRHPLLAGPGRYHARQGHVLSTGSRSIRTATGPLTGQCQTRNATL